ncbi:quinone oxidoreductase family protein [Janibacter sp. G1551]|uniref:quinone oxidoreductase family protein n=1 Tax=Janibacter sp. G1551 TaxID=3420440 RepID=UPI003D074C4E
MTTTRGLVVPTAGGGDVLEVREVDLAPPAPGEVQVKVAAVGVNFVDVYQREGIYPMKLPFVLGNEGAGTVTALGEGVTDLAVGDRVAWGQGLGSAADVVNRAADSLVPVPDGLDLETAAAAMLQGMTAHYLITSVWDVKAGDTALVHAAAGGVGQLLVQLITARGASVVATAGSPAKLEIARRLGAQHTIDYSTFAEPADLAKAVREANGGRGVDVAYDGVGRATFDASLLSLRPRGLMVLFGGASGQVPPLDLQRLNRLGSLVVTRPALGAFVATRDELLGRGRDVLSWLADGTITLAIGGRYRFDEVADAYAALEGRQTSGKLLLIP